MSQRELRMISFDEMPVDKHPLESVSEKYPSIWFRYLMVVWTADWTIPEIVFTAWGEFEILWSALKGLGLVFD